MWIPEKKLWKDSRKTRDQSENFTISAHKIVIYLEGTGDQIVSFMILPWIVIVHVLRYYRVIQKPHSLTAVLQKTWTLTEFARRKKRCHPLLVRLTLVRAQWVRQRESGTACSLARIAAWRSLCLKSKARFSIQCPYWLHLCIF